MALVSSPRDAVAELTNRRNASSKTYMTDTPGRLIWQGAQAVIHVPSNFAQYRRGDPVWLDCDTDFRFVGNRLTIGPAWYSIDVDVATMTIRGDWIDGGLGELRLAALDGVPFQPHPGTSVELRGSSAFIRNVVPDLDIEIRSFGDTFEVFKHINSADAPHELDWEIRSRVVDLTVLPLFETTGHDETRLATEILHEVGEPRLTDGVATFTFKETITGKTRQARKDKQGFGRDAIYPLTIDLTFGPVDISANANDGYDYDSVDWMLSYNGRWYIGHTFHNCTGGLRWTGATMEQGDIINSASLQFSVTSIDGGGITAGGIFGVDLDTAPVWSDTNRPTNTGVIIRTTATTALGAVTTTGSKTYTITSIIQEIVDRASWDQDTIGIVIDGTAGEAFSAKDSVTGGDVATLTVDFITGDAVYDQTDYQLFAAGDELPHYDLGSTPVIEAGDVTATGSDTAASTLPVGYPAYDLGDLLISIVGIDDDDTITPPATGPNGETRTILYNYSGATESVGTNGPSIAAIYWIGTATQIAGTQDWTTSAAEEWLGRTIKVPAGEFDSITPIGFVSARAGNNADVAGLDTATGVVPRANAKIVHAAVADIDPWSVTMPAGHTSISNQDIGNIAMLIAVRDAGTTALESVASVNFDLTGAAVDSLIGAWFAVNAPRTADGRTPVASVNTFALLETTTPFGCSIRIENVGGGDGVDEYKWQYSLNEGAWTDVTDVSSVIRVILTDDFTSGDDVPEYIGTVGDYVSDNNAALDATGTLLLTAVLPGVTSFETHANLTIVNADVADEDTIDLRIVLGTDVGLDVYTNLVHIVVDKAAEGPEMTQYRVESTTLNELPDLLALLDDDGWALAQIIPLSRVILLNQANNAIVSAIFTKAE